MGSPETAPEGVVERLRRLLADDCYEWNAWGRAGIEQIEPAEVEALLAVVEAAQAAIARFEAYTSADVRDHFKSAASEALVILEEALAALEAAPEGE